MENVDEQSTLLKANFSHPTYHESAPTLIRLRSSKWFILGTICLALFTDSFIYGVLVPVLPFMLRDRSRVSEGSEQMWISTMLALFGAAILIGSPVSGWFADKAPSRRLPLLLGLPILAGATVLLGAGTGVAVFLVSRALQGFSTAIVWTVGLALVRDTVAETEVGQCMGAAISSNSVGLVISPMLGGIIYAHAGLWGVLGMMIGLVVLNILLVVLMIEKRVAANWIVENASHETPPPVYGTVQGEVSQALPESNEAEYFSFRDAADVPPVYTPLVETPGVRTPQQQPEPTSKKRDSAPILRLMKSPRILTAVYGVFTQFGLLASFDAFLPLFVKRRFEWGSLGAGLIFLNLAIPALFGPVAGMLSDRYGPRKVALAGCILTAPPLVLLRLVGFEKTEFVVLLCFLLILIGLFLTLIISPLAADLSFAVDQMEADHPGAFGSKGAYAQAYALFNCSMAFACVIGPLLAGGVQDAFGAETVAWVLAVWVISPVIPVFLFLGDDVKRPSEDSTDGAA